MASFFSLISLRIILGVHSVLVALLSARAEVEYDPIDVEPTFIAKSFTDLGFPSKVLHGITTSGEIEITVS